MTFTKSEIYAQIRSRIERFGYHANLVTGGPLPRFAYTIGLNSSKGAELIFAGATFYLNSDVTQVIKTLAGRMSFADSLQEEVGALGTFSLRRVDSSWKKLLCLGVQDYYGRDDVNIWQVVPDTEHRTLDVPNLAVPFVPAVEPAWQWLTEPWRFAVSKRSIAVTNLGALRGELVTEAVRWEDNQWELFAGPGPDVPPSEMRETALGTLLGTDPTLEPVIGLRVGEGLWRDEDKLRWNEWRARR